MSTLHWLWVFFSFLVYNIYGFKEHGLSYLKQLMGPVLFLAPLMFVIELISHLVRPLSLGLRLYGNMVGGPYRTLYFFRFGACHYTGYFLFSGVFCLYYAGLYFYYFKHGVYKYCLVT